MGRPRAKSKGSRSALGRLLRLVVTVAVLAALAAAAARLASKMRERRALDEPPADWPPRREPSVAPEPAAAPEPEAEAAPEPWVEPGADGACPTSHPVKGKLSSKIFHLPEGANYARTKADGCYVSAEAATADGLRQSKR